jgi:hypothetical protein
MAENFLRLRLLVMILVFGLTVVGCETGETGIVENRPFFQYDLNVLNIPSNYNGEEFTISLIDNGIVQTSKNGIVVGGIAEAKFVWSGDSKTLTIRPNDNRPNDYYNDGRRYMYWWPYVAIKIGSNPQKVTKEREGFLISSLGFILGSGPIYYSSFE